MKRVLKHIALLAGGFFILCAAAQAQQGVCVYQDSHYEGPRRCFENSVQNFSNLGINDQISSFQIHGNVDIIFYQNSNYRGASKRYSSGESVLTGGMNDNFSSMKIVKSSRQDQWGDRGQWGYYGGSETEDDWQYNDEAYPGDDTLEDPEYGGFSDYQGRVCLYENQNYTGKQHCFENDNPRFENFGFDNKADSLRIVGDIEVELFQHADYRGFSRIYRNNVPRFTPEEHDQYSAIRIRKRGDSPTGINPTGSNPNNDYQTAKACLFPNKDYGGKPYCFNSDNPRFANFGFDNKADSILIKGDVEVILYQHENYTGYSRVFRNNVPRFKGKDHDQFSSIRIRQR